MKTKLITPLLIVSLVSNVFGVVTPSVTPPAAEGTKFFNSSTVSTTGGSLSTSGVDQNASLVGDDNLSKKNIDRGENYKANLGIATGKIITNPNGTKVFVQPDENGTYPTSVDNLQTAPDEDKMLDPAYKAWYDQYAAYATDDNLTTKRDREKALKGAGMTQNYSEGNTVNDMTTRYLKGNNPLSSGQSVTRLFRTENVAEKNAELKELDKNASTMYKELYSSDPSTADIENLKNKNYGAVSTAFKGVEALGQELTQRLSGPKIKCQIVRQLVPSYMCPLPGKDGVRYPGSPDMANIRKVNILEAKSACNNDCWTDPGELSCVPKQVLTTDEIVMPTSTISVFPTWSETSATINMSVSNAMPVDYLKFKINILNNPQTNKTDAEWEEFLQDSGFKIRYSILEVNPVNPLDPPITIIDRENINIKSSVMEITAPVNRILSNIRIKIWKPYISNDALQAYRFQYLFDKLTAANIPITISNFESKYTSDSLYFCQAMQMVATPNQCVGKTIPFTTGDDQFNYLCLSGSKRIGPDPVFGGFYSQDACEFRCVRHEECIPTYRNYTNFAESTIYKAEISCLDDPDNNHCTQAKCEALFAEQETRPLNEMVVQNDDTFVYTVRNKALTDTIRPKIDLAAELSGTADYDKVFENEEKDAAYLSMLERQSYNRIAYRIGTPSPANLAYHKNKISDTKSEFLVDLKPNSFDIDSGKTFNVYSVIKLTHSFTPKAGTFHLNNHDITATLTNIQFEDISYMIKTNASLGGWEVFKRDEWAKFLSDTTTYSLDASGSIQEERHLDWVNTPQYKISSFAKLNQTSGDFEVFSSAQQAPNFATEIFTNSKDFYRYKISEWIESDIHDTPGGLIHDQLPINHDTWIKKLYIDPFAGPYYSVPKDYTVYLLYSETKLSYDQIMKEIEGPNYESVKIEPENNKWGAYNLLSSKLFRSKEIKYDGELRNQIQPLIMGTKDKTTVSTTLTPGISEKGKKVFKFLFLYDDNEPNPFEISNP